MGYRRLGLGAAAPAGVPSYNRQAVEALLAVREALGADAAQQLSPISTVLYDTGIVAIEGGLQTSLKDAGVSLLELAADKLQLPETGDAIADLATAMMGKLATDVASIMPVVGAVVNVLVDLFQYLSNTPHVSHEQTKAQVYAGCNDAYIAPFPSSGSGAPLPADILSPHSRVGGYVGHEIPTLGQYLIAFTEPTPVQLAQMRSGWVPVQWFTPQWEYSASANSGKAGLSQKSLPHCFTRRGGGYGGTLPTNVLCVPPWTKAQYTFGGGVKLIHTGPTPPQGAAVFCRAEWVPSSADLMPGAEAGCKTVFASGVEMRSCKYDVDDRTLKAFRMLRSAIAAAWRPVGVATSNTTDFGQSLWPIYVDMLTLCLGDYVDVMTPRPGSRRIDAAARDYLAWQVNPHCEEYGWNRGRVGVKSLLNRWVVKQNPPESNERAALLEMLAAARAAMPSALVSSAKMPGIKTALARASAEMRGGVLTAWQAKTGKGSKSAGAAGWLVLGALLAAAGLWAYETKPWRRRTRSSSGSDR